MIIWWSHLKRKLLDGPFNSPNLCYLLMSSKFIFTLFDWLLDQDQETPLMIYYKKRLYLKAISFSSLFFLFKHHSCEKLLILTTRTLSSYSQLSHYSSWVAIHFSVFFLIIENDWLSACSMFLSLLTWDFNREVVTVCHRDLYSVGALVFYFQMFSVLIHDAKAPKTFQCSFSIWWLILRLGNSLTGGLFSTDMMWLNSGSTIVNPNRNIRQILLKRIRS